MTSLLTERPSLLIAAELRAEIARQGLNMAEMARQLGVPQAWVSRRLGRGADVDLTFEEVLSMAKALDVPIEGLLEPLYGIRDSNPEPADLVHSALTSRDAWELAA